jgi:hypothetical protein
MSSTVATLFAELGFKIDNQGIDTFRTTLKEIQKELGETMKTSANTNKSLSAVLKKLNNVNSSFNPTKMQEWRKQLNTGVKSYIDMIGANEKALNGLSTKAVDSSRRMKLLTGRVDQGSIALSTYLTRLEAVIAALARLRAAGVNLPRVGGGLQGGGNGSRGGGTGGGHPPVGGGSGMGALLAGAGLGTFLKPMLPMGMGVGGLLGSGYMVKEIVTSGREMMAMELKMKSVSGESADFARNMKYVDDLSQHLGLSLIDTGNAFANIVVTAKDKMNPEQMQKMFTGFNKYYAAVHMTTADQKLANLSIQQMFGKDKIQAQEARLQMGQRVTPFIKLLTQAAKEQLGDKFTSFDDVMRKGLLDPSKLLPEVAKLLADIAENGGALEEALHNSQVAQIRFNNSLTKFSYTLMKSGFDEFLAKMFVLGAEIVPMLTVAFKWLFKAIKSFYSIIMALGEWVIDHPFLAVLSTSLVLLLLNIKVGIPLITAMKIAFYNAGAAASFLWGVIRKLMFAGGIVLLISLLADFQNYFMLGNKDGILGSWEDFFIEWWSVLDKQFAITLLKFEMFKQSMNPFGTDLSFMGNIEASSGEVFDMRKAVRETPLGAIVGWIKDQVESSRDFPTPTRPKPTSQVIQDMNGDGVRKNIYVTVDFNNLPQSVQNNATSGDLFNFGIGVGQSINVGGLGQNNH